MSYLYFVAAPVALWIAVKKSGARRNAIVFLLIATVFAYARFVEPRILLTAEHDVELSGCFESAGAFRVTVFSDTHNGIFGNAMPIERITKAVNATRPDFVLVAGDYVYFSASRHVRKKIRYLCRY